MKCCYVSLFSLRLQLAEEEIEKLKKVEPVLRKELETCQEVSCVFQFCVFGSIFLVVYLTNLFICYYILWPCMNLRIIGNEEKSLEWK